MKPTYYVLLLAVVLYGCMPLKSVQNYQSTIPSLGVIGKRNGSFITKGFQQVGFPKLTTPIALTATELPFSKNSFKEYQQLKTQRGEQVEVNYDDSLKVKPKYLRLQVLDKIALTAQLNQGVNTEVRSYLEKDAQCKIVSEIAVYTHPMLVDQLLHAKSIFLNTGITGELEIQFVNKKKKERFALSKRDIFSYGLMSFCWGEDVYGNAKVNTLSTNGNCPEGTEKSAHKLADTKSYLKL